MFHADGPTFWELARQSLSSTERGYDLLAPKFDLTPFRTPDFVLDALSHAMQTSAPFERSLDLCCGTGAGMQTLRPLSKHVVGLDMSEGMLDVAKENSDSWSGEATLEFVRGKALDAPELGAPFDAVVCLGALGHFVEREELPLLRAIHGQLRPGGRFYFATALKPNWWTVQALLSRGFNFAMAIRNTLIRPPFVMYYLTFLLPAIELKLEQAGFEVKLHREGLPRFAANCRIVEAIKR